MNQKLIGNGDKELKDFQTGSTADQRKYDSTGMFHWCPEQLLATCLIVSFNLNRDLV